MRRILRTSSVAAVILLVSILSTMKVQALTSVEDGYVYYDANQNENGEEVWACDGSHTRQGVLSGKWLVHYKWDCTTGSLQQWFFEWCNGAWVSVPQVGYDVCP